MQPPKIHDYSTCSGPLGRYQRASGTCKEKCTKVQHCVYLQTTDPSGRAVWCVDLQPLDCWNRRFKSRRAHRSWFAVCCVASGLSDEQITRSEFYPVCVRACVFVCVWLWVIQKHEQWGGVGPSWAAASQENISKKHLCTYFFLWSCSRPDSNSKTPSARDGRRSS